MCSFLSTQDRAGNTARQLHLLDPDDPESLFLVQLPTVLPIQAPPATQQGVKAGTSGRGAAAGKPAGGSRPAAEAGSDTKARQGETDMLPVADAHQGDQRTGAAGSGGGMLGAGEGTLAGYVHYK